MLTGSGTTSSIWMKTTEVPQFDELKKDEECEVLIVGAGITGLIH